MSSATMNTKPILFNTDMVRAILESRKTVTRRVVKNIPAEARCTVVCSDSAVFRWQRKMQNVDIFLDTEKEVSKTYLPGDILYVRETWTELCYVDESGTTHYDQTMFFYAADGNPGITLIDADGFELDDQRVKWRPSIHMPKEAARIFLRVTGVRVERLKDMKGNDYIGEGATDWNDMVRVWDSTIKPADLPLYGWLANPWVWVIEFERISREEATGGNG